MLRYHYFVPKGLTDFKWAMPKPSYPELPFCIRVKSWQPQRILGDEKGQLHEFILTGWCQVASCHLQEVQFCEAKAVEGLGTI